VFLDEKLLEINSFTEFSKGLKKDVLVGSSGRFLGFKIILSLDRKQRLFLKSF
jgi:hypothetical protein